MQQRRLLHIVVSTLLAFIFISGLAAGSVFANQSVPDSSTDLQAFPTNTLPPDVIAQTGTFTHTPLPSATDTIMPSATDDPTSTPVPTETYTPTNTLVPSATSTVTAVPTSERSAEEILASPTILSPLGPEDGAISNGTAIPTRMPRLIARERDGTPYEILNFLLLGHDSESIDQADDVFRTDTMIIVSVNLTTNTVSMLSLPRDLLVYIPDWGMHRLNLAWGRGERVGWTDGGFGMLRQTILYNFGIEMHYFAMIDFSGFKTVIDTLDGVTIPVDCAVQDYRWTGEYNENDEPTFEFITLDVGVQEMDSITALMYARSRKNSSDFDRGRRQQQLLRAIWYEAQNSDLLSDVPQLYNELLEIVDTNIPLDVMIQLAPLALTLQPTEVENHFFRLGFETEAFTTPDGSNVQVPRIAIIDTIRAFQSPPTENRLVTENAAVAIYDSSGQGRQFDMVAAERLIWEGLSAMPMGEASLPETFTGEPNSVVIDYSGESKGSSVSRIINLLNVNPATNYAIEINPDAEFDLEIYITENYSACVERDVLAPVDVTPSPTQTN